MKWESSSRRSIDGDWIRENESNEHFVGSSYDDEYDSILDSINTDDVQSFLDDMEQTKEDIEKTPEELGARAESIRDRLLRSMSISPEHINQVIEEEKIDEPLINSEEMSVGERQKLAEVSFKDFVERAKASELENNKTKNDIQSMFSDSTTDYQETKENSLKERNQTYGLQDMINDTDIQRKNDSINQDIGRKF